MSCKFSIGIGSYLLSSHVRLNVASCRKLFGDAPIVISDGSHERSKDVEKIAEDYGCAYVGEDVDRGHFSGDLKTAACALALAKAENCDVAIKLNQRFILCDPDAPKRLVDVFSDGSIDLALPGKLKEEGIVHHLSKFHAKFPRAVCCVAMRASAFEPQELIDSYEKQWKTGTDRFSAFVEVLWNSMAEGKCAGKTATLDWLTEHTAGQPFKFLRKSQNVEEDYRAYAKTLGIENGHWPVGEWQNLKSGSYLPAPRA